MLSSAEKKKEHLEIFIRTTGYLSFIFLQSHIIILINIPFNRFIGKQILNTENALIFLCSRDSYGQNGLLPICQLA